MDDLPVKKKKMELVINLKNKMNNIFEVISYNR